MYLNFCMFDWSGKNGDESGKSQGILISRVSGNPGTGISMVYNDPNILFKVDDLI